MPIVLAVIVAALAVALLATVLMPLALVQRYRMGTARRQARGWIATLNVVMIGLSAALLLFSAAVTSIWVPRAFPYTLTGLAVGCALGLLGVAASRWESTPQRLHYTPSRLLVLAITAVVAARIVYGIWRAWHAWQTVPEGEAWLDAAGAAGSLAAGATVLGYYLTFWAVVRRRVSAHRRAFPRRT